MTARKLVAIVLGGGILGAQLLATLPPLAHRNWYWPFVDYPMYATAHYRGEAFARHRLLGTPCDPSAGVTVFTPADLGLVNFRLIYLLRDAAAQESADAHLRTFIAPSGSAYAQSEIAAIVRQQHPGEYCHLRIQEQALTIGEPVPAQLDDLWGDLWEVDLRLDQAEAQP